MGDSLYDQQERSQAAAYYQQVVYTSSDSSLMVDSLSGYALHKLGVCAYYSQAPEQAIAFYRMAVQTRTSALGSLHHQVAKSCTNLAYVFNKTNQLDSSARYLYQAAAIYDALSAPPELPYTRTLTSLTMLAEEFEDSQLAKTAAAKVLELSPLVRVPQPASEYTALHYNIARSLAYLDQYDLARQHARIALRSYQAAGLKDKVARTYNILYVISSREGLSGAVRYLDSALHYLPTSSRTERSYFLSDLAREQVLAGQLTQAASNLELAQKDLPPDDELHIHNAGIWAMLYEAKLDATEALHHHNLALARIDSSAKFENDVLRITPSNRNIAYFELLVPYLTNRAAFLANQHRHQEALRDYETILQLRERLRRDVSSRSSRERLSTNLRPILDRAIDLCYQLYTGGKQEIAWQALQYSEWARAYDLLRSYRRGGSNKPGGSESELRARIARLERQVTTDTTLRPGLTDAQLRLDRLVRQQNIRDTAALPPLDRDRLQNYLDRQQQDLVVYHLTDSLGYRFVLTPTGGISLEHLPTGPELTERVKGWQSAIAAAAYRRKSIRPPGEQAALDREFIEQGKALAQRLHLETPQRPSIYLPDGILHYLPFAALPVGSIADKQLDYGTISYLGDHAPLSFGYSIATLLAQEKAPTPDYQLGLLALAPTFTGGELQALPLGEQEVAAVAGHCDQYDVLLGAEANRTNFLAQASGARILHLSTHGRANLEQPNLSYVAFTQTGSTADADERLYYNELGTLHLPAELVVLSACETSIGRPVPGETVASLATAFAAAGAHSTVTTLWQVDERATLELLDAFYGRLAAGDGRQLALHEAQQELRRSKDYAHPYYWAGLALHGSVAPLDIHSPAAPPYVWLVAVVLVVALALLWYRRKSFSFAGQMK